MPVPTAVQASSASLPRLIFPAVWTCSRVSVRNLNPPARFFAAAARLKREQSAAASSTTDARVNVLGKAIADEYAILKEFYGASN